MEFSGKGTPLDSDGLRQAETLLGASRPAIWAILTVETRGFGYLPDRRPQILFERHVFHRQTGGAHDAAHPDISSPQPGGYAGGSGEYDRLARAIALDREAALKSTSWGIAQIMGFNHRVAGYETVDALVEDMVCAENRQLAAMATFINGNNLTTALVAGDWATFARGYNGRDYARNQYDTRLSAAFARMQVAPPDLRLRSAQAALLYLGFNPGPVDGLSGRRTRSALVEFQTRRQLAVSGELDDETENALRHEAFPDG